MIMNTPIVLAASVGFLLACSHPEPKSKNITPLLRDFVLE